MINFELTLVPTVRHKCVTCINSVSVMMDNLTGSVHLGTNNCLICNQNVENSLLIKKEIEENCDDHVQTDPGQNYNSEGYLLHPKANTEEPARTNKVGPSLSTPEVQDHLNFVNTLCKLLKLTSSVTTRLRRSKVCQLNPKLFCYDCSLIISDAIKLFEQIEVLQNNVQKIVHESYLNHVNDVLVGHVNDGCKKRKTCSKIDRLREIIVNGKIKIQDRTKVIIIKPGGCNYINYQFFSVLRCPSSSLL